MRLASTPVALRSSQTGIDVLVRVLSLKSVVQQRKRFSVAVEPAHWEKSARYRVHSIVVAASKNVGVTGLRPTVNHDQHGPLAGKLAGGLYKNPEIIFFHQSSSISQLGLGKLSVFTAVSLAVHRSIFLVSRQSSKHRRARADCSTKIRGRAHLHSSESRQLTPMGVSNLRAAPFPAVSSSRKNAEPGFRW